MLTVWLQFGVLGAVVAIAGYWLSRFGDVIAERTGLSGAWVGLALMATVTSLPELVTGISAVRLSSAPDLAVGDVLGSCLFNLLLIGLLDLCHRPACMFTQASQGHALSTGYSGILLGIVGINLATPLVVGPFSAATVLVIPVYLLALRSIFTYERRKLMEPAEPAVARYPDIGLRRAILGYLGSAAGVVAAGILLPGAAIDLAAQMGWTSTFVGTQFLAVATSLPELVVTLAAVRLGVLDMAFANLLGSNLFNMVVLAVDDMAYAEGPLLSNVSAAHGVSVVAALLMNGIVTAGLIYRPTTRPAGMASWASLALALTYLVNTWILATGQTNGSA